MYLDVRDTLGKWLAAVVTRINEDGSIDVHYDGWDPKWDETVPSEFFSSRLADFGVMCGDLTNAAAFKQKDWVHVYATKPSPPMWVWAQINKKDHAQVQVSYDRGNKKIQYWFHCSSDQIVHAQAPKMATAHREGAEGTQEKKKEEDEYFVGMMIEVKDTCNRWLPAEVLQTLPDKGGILVHYVNWSAQWDEWLDTSRSTDRDRIRPLGAEIEDTKEIAQKKREDELFRRGLAKQSFCIVDMDKDGNCLFRAVAHQIYNDPDRHIEVRKMCYDYMERDRDFFSLYVGEDFDVYLKRQRNLHEWGDHVEIVAMREMFNLNVAVYDKEAINAPKPLGLGSSETAHTFPIMRFSFHGANHYNSLIHKDTRLPLGAGADRKRLFDLRQARLEEEAKCSRPSRKMSRKDSRVGLLKQQTAGDVSGVMVTEADVRAIWAEFDTKRSGVLKSKYVRQVATRVFTLLYERKKKYRLKHKLEIESTEKAWVEFQDDIPDIIDDLLEKSPTMRLETGIPQFIAMATKASWDLKM